ncbi:MAG: nucleotidyltransferase [Nanoarchaeota archaeon]|nr:nucleotidyltransferase [Nanoarchaeota archaeon]
MSHNTTETNAKELFELLESLSKYIEENIKMYTLGGTALTILEIKPSTRDIDINIHSYKEYLYICKLFEQMGFKKIGTIRWLTQEGLAFDLFTGSNFLGTQLLPDCLKKSKFVKSFGKLELYTLGLEDIIITKLARGDERDFIDIKKILDTQKIDLNDFINRYKETMENSAVAFYKQKLLDLIEIKFGQWGFKLNTKLISEVKKWEEY